MTRALVISHDPSERPGLIGEGLCARGYALDAFVVCDDVHRPESHRLFPSLDGVDLLVVMGAPWSVYDHAAIGTWIDRELALVRDAHTRGVPVLGICFGGQALAAALGGRVEPTRPELGFVAVHTAAPARVPAGPWFQWHGDCFVPPPGAELLAHSDAGAQAFRIGRSLGVQVHPEVGAQLAREWLAPRVGTTDGPPDPLFHTLGIDPAALVDEAVAHEARSRANADALLAAFLEEVAR
jgi:GMP synthase-like glutamine amidotransferase